jgi:hypothetical protein
MHASLEWQEIRSLPHLEHRKSYTRPQRIVTPNAMTLRTREMSIALLFICFRLRRRLIAMSTGVSRQIWGRRVDRNKQTTFQDEGRNATNRGIYPQEYCQAHLINNAIEGLPGHRRRVKKANDHYRGDACHPHNIREHDQLGDRDGERILFKDL